MRPGPLGKLSLDMGSDRRAVVPFHAGYRLPHSDATRIESVLYLVAEAPVKGRADLPRLGAEAVSR